MLGNPIAAVTALIVLNRSIIGLLQPRALDVSHSKPVVGSYKLWRSLAMICSVGAVRWRQSGLKTRMSGLFKALLLLV